MSTSIDALISNQQIAAVIFDLDGTMVNNNPYHLASWRHYLQELGIEISEENYRKYINGRTNKDAIEYIYQRTMSDDEAMVYTLQKEAIYRKLYAPHIQPVDGLIELLKKIHIKNIPMGIATSGIQVNIDFLFEHIPIQSYFNAIINSAHIKKGKPDPEIFLTTAAALSVQPNACLVFEDAAVGVRAAKDAGMYVVALTTTQTEAELAAADLIMNNFTTLL